MSDAAHPRPTLHTSKASWKSSTVSAMVTNFASPHRRSWLLNRQARPQAVGANQDHHRALHAHKFARVHFAGLDRAGKRRADGGVVQFFFGEALAGFAGNEQGLEAIDFL